MPDNGFHFPLQIRMPMRIIIQRLQFFYQRRAILYPAVKGFYRIVLCAVRIVKQGQFSLQVRTKLKHHSLVLLLFLSVKLLNFKQITIETRKKIRINKDRKHTGRTIADIPFLGCCTFVMSSGRHQFLILNF